MTEVELRLVAPNSAALKGIREVANASDKLHKDYEKQQKRQKGLIADVEDELKKLQEAQKNAMTIQHIEKYNKKIAEAKQALKEYNEAGVQAQEKTESLKKTISNWIISLGGATVALNAVKNAVIATTTGLNAFNIAGAAAKQVMYNLVTNAQSLTAGLGKVIEAQKKLNELRTQELFTMFKAKGYQIEYNKYLVQAHDQLKTGKERIEAYDKAMESHGKMIDLDIKRARERMIATKEMLEASPDDEKLKQELVSLAIIIRDFEVQRNSAMKEVESMRSGLIKKEWQDKIDAWHKEIDLDNEKYEQELKNAETIKGLSNDVILYRLEGLDRELKAAEIAYEKDMELFKNNAEMKMLLTQRYGLQIIEIEKNNLDKLKKEYSKFQEQIYFNPLQQGGSEQLRPYKGTMPTDNSDEKDKNKERLDAMKDFAKEVYSFTQDLLDREAEDARRHREILDTRVSDLQSELETEVRLYEAGYSSNVGAKKKELSELKKQRENALREEEKAIQKQRQMQMIAQGVNIFTSSTQILKSFTGLGPLGLPLAAAAITAMFALIATTRKKTQEAVMLARGGHGTVNGRLHSQGGEPFLNHVEVEAGEKWGVLSRSASRKYGKVFENMVDSFNKEKLPIPKAGININNVTVENTGPNQRLDAILQENRKANSRETVTEYSDKIVITKGSNKRVIRK